MADDKITSIIKCQNIAPIENLTREIKSSSLKMGVFANNGSGKTFLSRLFRLTEKQDELVLDENGKSPTDKLLTFGKNNGTFSFKITDKEGNVKDDFSISVTKGQIPTIPDTKYLYHTFNQDYVEQNDPMFAFKELYECIENYKKRIKDSSIRTIKPKTNRLTSFANTVKKVSLEKVIEWTIEKGGDKVGGYF